VSAAIERFQFSQRSDRHITRLIDVRFLNIDRLRGRMDDRTPATTKTNYRPNPAQVKDFAYFSIARHPSLTINEPKSLKLKKDT
jgi:hypothetical protein